MMFAPLFGGLPGGIESVVVILIIFLLIVAAGLWGAWKIVSWLKSVVEHGVGMNDDDEES